VSGGELSTTNEKIEGIREKVEKRIEDELSQYPVKPEPDPISSYFVRECARTEQYGLGALLAALLKDRFIYNYKTGEHLMWAGHSWSLDAKHEHLVAVETEGVVRLLEELGLVGNEIVAASAAGNSALVGRLRYDEKLLLAAIKTLRRDHGRNAAIKFSHSCVGGLGISGDELDQKRHLLGCRNGVFDTRSGRFCDGRPDDWISKACPTDFKGINEPAPVFIASVTEICGGRPELVGFLQRFFGYAISGLRCENKFLVLCGSGRNGKTTLVSIIRHVLGPLAAPIQSELLLDQGRTRSSAGPSPDLMALRGLRIAFASESDEGRRFSLARVKYLSGGDTIVARELLGKQEYFEPSHTLVMLTNHRPHASAHDFAFWERVLLVPFDLSFVDRDPIADNERPVKKGLAEDLKQESSGILAWMLKGIFDYYKQGLNPPKEVLEATAEYHKAEDLLGDWQEERCEKIDLAVTTAKELFDDFSSWFKENISEKTTMSQRRFGELLARRFQKKLVNGRTMYCGLKLRNL
jgi:putative DNA primase/helicase